MYLEMGELIRQLAELELLLSKSQLQTRVLILPQEQCRLFASDTYHLSSLIMFEKIKKLGELNYRRR